MKVTAVDLDEAEIQDIFERASYACRDWAKTRMSGREQISFRHADGEDALTPALIRHGVCLALTHSEHVAKQAAGATHLGFVDSIAVDFIVQYALFESIIYG